MLPEYFEEQWIRCYCKKGEKGRIAEAKKAFADWCKKNGCPSVKIILIIYNLLFYQTDILNTIEYLFMPVLKIGCKKTPSF